jgi:predicted enzyme related to lactoylglutathione lyase
MRISSCAPARAVRHALLAVLALFIGVTSVATVQAASLQSLALPPLTATATGEHHPGKIVWLELVTPDLAVSERFYGSLFGWTFRELHADGVDYAVASLGEEPVAGLLQKTIKPGEHRQPAWLTFLAVQDVDAATRLALAHGARVLAEPRSYPARGRQAILKDPQGAVFALLASQTDDPPDFLAAPGQWIWSALRTPDASVDVGFYQTLLGYDAFDLPSDDGLDHIILSSGDYARASVNSIPAEANRRPPHWLNFVRVDDAAAMTARAVAAGGRVLVAPHVDRHGGQMAIIADPSGAPFGVMEWTDTDTKEEPK